MCKIASLNQGKLITLLFPLLDKNVVRALSDEDLVKEYLKTQKQNYFDQLYKRYSSKIFGKSLSLLKNEELAADATQDIFIKILLNLSKFSGKSRFSTWIYSITYNYCIDAIRKRKKDRSILIDDIVERHDMADTEVEDKFLLEMNVSRLKLILNKIPVSDKAILLMKYQDAMSIKEIGKIVGKSESAVKMKIKRAKQKFRKIYSENFKEV